MSLNNFLIWIFVFGSFVFGWLARPVLPPAIPIHWNAWGIPDRWLDANLAVYLVPIASLFLVVISTLVKKFDHYLSQVKAKNKVERVFVALTIFLFLIQLAMIGWNLDWWRFNILYLIFPVTGILFSYLGLEMRGLPINQTFGIRLPWTLSNEKVWQKTHEQGSWLFVFLGLIIIASLGTLNYAMIIIIASIAIVVVYLAGYSYYQSRVHATTSRQNRDHKNSPS